MEPIRLNKALANAGLCSRRQADEWVRAGLVTVNGICVTELGSRILPGKDIVAVRGKETALTAGLAEKHQYILLHKPIQVVSTVNDPEGRQTVLDILPAAARRKRLYPVGRLDYFSEGLLLLTDDGELTHRLTHPRYHLPREYQVTVRETPTESMFRIMREGMTLAEGERLSPVEVKPAADPRHFTLILHQGLNRQIRRMCRDLGLTILRLQRTALGPLSLGDLPKGQSRSLSAQEIHALRKAAGL